MRLVVRLHLVDSGPEMQTRFEKPGPLVPEKHPLRAIRPDGGRSFGRDERPRQINAAAAEIATRCGCRH